jgi:hypothetical protein
MHFSVSKSSIVLLPEWLSPHSRQFHLFQTQNRNNSHTFEGPNYTHVFPNNAKGFNSFLFFYNFCSELLRITLLHLKKMTTRLHYSVEPLPVTPIASSNCFNSIRFSFEMTLLKIIQPILLNFS